MYKVSRFFAPTAFGVLLLGLLIRIGTLGEPDLVDSTEGRYATIVQDMVLSKNWSELQIRMFGEIESYLGKPPLHFWLAATSMKVFGMNEWAVRLPSFISALVSILAVILFSWRFFGSQSAILSGCILLSSGMFFFLSGACLIDTTLSAFLTISLVGLAFCILDSSTVSSRSGGIVAAAALGLGFLVKGPVALVLIGGTVLLWLVLLKDLTLLRKIPWISGVTVIILIATPWFLLQEFENPGFLNYFFINENLKRYLTSDYGDKYGVGHTSAFGMSWIMLVLAFLPWTFFLLGNLGSWVKYRVKEWPLHCSVISFGTVEERARLFCLIWGIFPALFFTFSKQLTPTYMLSGLPGLALLCGALFLKPSGGQDRLFRSIALILLGIAFLTTVGFSVAGIIVHAPTGLLLCGILVGGLIAYLTINFLLKHRARPLLSMVGTLCAVVFLVYLSFIFNLTTYISARRSTAMILAKIRAEVAPPNNLVGIPFGNPFSANFYARSESARPLTVEWLTQEEAVSKRTPNLIVRSSDLEILHPETKRMYSIRGTIGPWLWFEFKK